MTVKTCDRCGKIYDNRIKGYIISCEEEELYSIMKRKYMYDLCPSCFDMFMKWINTTAVEVKL